MSDLRTRVKAAIRSVALGTDLADGKGELAIVHIENALDAVMTIVDEALRRAGRFENGLCRMCHRPESQPHDMTCPEYVGRVEHFLLASRPIADGAASLLQCSCGQFRWSGECPNSSETGRGPRLELQEEAQA